MERRACPPPGPLRLTAYAAEQVLWLVPLVLGLALFVVGGVLAIIWVGLALVLGALLARPRGR